MQQMHGVGVFILNRINTLELTAGIFKNELVEKCLEGNVLSFKTLYGQYVNAMLNTSLRIVNNVADAEDIVQESFIAAFGNLEKFNYASTFGAWLKRIVINRSINHLRNKKAQIINIEQVNINDQEEDLPDESEIKFKVEEIKKAVSNLPAGYRIVFTLSAFEGYGYEEIAELLKITPSTVRTQYHRAKKQLLNAVKNKI